MRMPSTHDPGDHAKEGMVDAWRSLAALAPAPRPVYRLLMTPVDEDLLTLKRKPRISGWLEVAWRVAAIVALLAVLLLFHWLERHGLKDTHDGDVSFIDVIYFTMISA